MNFKGKLYNIRATYWRFLLFKMRLCFPPWCFLFSSFDKYGIEFPWKGDTIIWSWPWRHTDRKARFISMNFSGTGEFGDACFNSLKDIDQEWEEFANACNNIET